MGKKGKADDKKGPKVPETPKVPRSQHKLQHLYVYSSQLSSRLAFSSSLRGVQTVTRGVNYSIGNLSNSYFTIFHFFLQN